MKYFYPAVCKRCLKNKENILQRTNFHLNYKELKMEFKCYTCGVQEDYFLQVVEEGKKEEIVKKNN